MAMGQKQKLVLWVVALTICAAIVVIVLCVWLYRDTTPHISFSDWVAIKPVKAESDTFRFAVASMVSAEETWTTYKELVDYIAAHIGGRASMVLRPSYSDVRILLEESKVDLAFVCTGTYVACRRAGTLELLAVPEFKGDIKYRCLFIVRDDSEINSIAELRGKSFAFTDAESNTGCMVPTWVVKKQGQDPETYFSKIIYTGSHDRSIHAVVSGVIEAASVDSLVFYSFLKAHPEMKERLRVIWESEAFGAPPIVAPVNLSKDTKEQLRAVFLSMSQDTQGRKILDDLDIDKFRKPEKGEYDSAYKIWKAVNR
jgi:phosphonate transport system substrate-binding protein